MYTNNEIESARDVSTNPHKNLMKAMMERAVLDLNGVDGKMAWTAHAWLIDYDNILESPLSVAMCCEALGINYQDFMKRLDDHKILINNIPIDQFIIAS